MIDSKALNVIRESDFGKELVRVIKSLADGY